MIIDKLRTKIQRGKLSASPDVSRKVIEGSHKQRQGLGKNICVKFSHSEICKFKGLVKPDTTFSMFYGTTLKLRIVLEEKDILLIRSIL